MARDFHNQARVRTSLFQVCLFFLAVCGCASTAGAQQTRADVLADDRAAKAEGTDTSVALERGRSPVVKRIPLAALPKETVLMVATIYVPPKPSRAVNEKVVRWLARA